MIESPINFTFRSLRLMGGDKNKTWLLTIKVDKLLEEVPHFVPLLFVPDIKDFLERIEESHAREKEQPSLMGDYEKERERIKAEMGKFIAEHPAFGDETTVVNSMKFTQDHDTVLTLEIPDSLVSTISHNRFQLDQWLVAFSKAEPVNILESIAGFIISRLDA